jgi:hypothetical protein
MLWKDVWNFGSLQHLYPHMFSFVREPNCSVSRFLSLLSYYNKLFQLPLSTAATHQLAELLDSLEEWNRDTNSSDCWTYIWGSRIFTSKQAYESLIGQSQAPAPLHWLWKSCCQGKHKVLFLLLLNDRLTTRNLLRRKRFNIPSVNFVLCSHDCEETLKHLFFECEFAQTCWAALHIVWGLSLLVLEMIEQQRRYFLPSCYMEVIMSATWVIWIHRKNIIFNNEALCFRHWKHEFREIFLLGKFRAKPSLESLMTSWLSSL